MAVATYIQDLLYRYECVIIPEFGAFITQRHSARLDQNNNQFYPPAKTVSFNRQLINNDGLLANYIMEVENISYESAVEVLKDFVLDLNIILQENGSVELGKIGEFILTAEDKLQFKPASHTNFLKEAFGLPKIPVKGIEREEKTSKSTVIGENNSAIKTSGNWLKYAAVGLLTIGLSGAAGLNIYTNQVDAHNLAEQQKAASQLEAHIQKATFVIDNPLPMITLNVARQNGKYHIVAGAFRMEENAEKKVRQLREKGFKAREIGANKYGLHQVVYSSHERRIEALQALKKVKKSNSSAWLLVLEL